MYEGIFISAVEEAEHPDLIIAGVPFDGTVSWRPGSRFAPNSIRRYSYALETYSPYQGQDMEDHVVMDIGNCPDIIIGDTMKTLQGIEIWVEDIIKSYNDVPLLFMGGEHLISFPIIKRLYKEYDDMIVIHMDAHLDLRKTYEGNKFSHATVMHHVKNLIGKDSLIQMGMRSGTREEFEEVEKDKTYYDFIEEKEDIIERIDGRPIYISLDLDVLDPSVMSGVGTPEPGGWDFNDLLHTLLMFESEYIVGMDVVEHAPFVDNTGVSSIVAAKIIREAICLMVR